MPEKIVIALIAWTVFSFALFFILTILPRFIRGLIRHSRDRAALVALREMRYNDIRRSL